MEELDRKELGQEAQRRQRSASPDILRAMTSFEGMEATDKISQPIKLTYERAIQIGKELSEKVKTFKDGIIDYKKYFEERYKTDYNRIGSSMRVNASTGIRFGESKSRHYQNSMNPKEGIITTITNYRDRDKEEWKRLGLEKEHPEINKALPNFIILHQQYLGAARELSITPEPLTRITRKNVSNPETMQALSDVVLPGEAKTLLPKSDQYFAVLGTPNGHGAFYLLAKEYPDREITHIEVKRHSTEEKMEYIHFYIAKKQS
ncbi:MAG: hypothetical protein JO215_14265 [Ktedonobacteraceae bacterium]|nr:hypothetical protein [Ktedonobacteraceae bacterium]MBV9709866.1 hypothetical protein [Ktedonobacteraceae bacterium]